MFFDFLILLFAQYTIWINQIVSKNSSINWESKTKMILQNLQSFFFINNNDIFLHSAAFIQCKQFS